MYFAECRWKPLRPLRYRMPGAAQASPVMSKLSQPAEWRAYFSALWPFRNTDDSAHLLDALRKAGPTT